MALLTAINGNNKQQLVTRGIMGSKAFRPKGAKTGLTCQRSAGWTLIHEAPYINDQTSPYVAGTATANIA